MNTTRAAHVRVMNFLLLVTGTFRRKAGRARQFGAVNFSLVVIACLFLHFGALQSWWRFEQSYVLLSCNKQYDGALS